ncbi:CAP domain-containing protein [Saccharibacillus qingshengii]|uniref:CAP and S-layer homology domain-containing protein n=1 Tax=Saccharibacillus qingshengii TaxID=1763540 RepID=UPI001557BB3D|nr:CAP domain-containing protein [Saccharibacillus qingshengii]
MNANGDNTKERTGHRGMIGRKWAAAVLAALIVGTAGMPAYPVQPVSAAEVQQGSYTQDQLDGLAYLNGIRAKVGVGPLELEPRLTQASQSHAAYYNRHHFEGLSAHNETQGTEGFTGSSPKERAQTAGWSDTRSLGIGEVMSYNKATTREAIDAWLSTAYHRKIILDGRYKWVGIGLQEGTAVMNPGFLDYAQLDPAVNVYPYDKMTDADIGFYGFENPNPLDLFGVEYSGGIISASSGRDIESFHAAITDSKGQEVPFYSELQYDTLYLYPKEILDGYSLYSVKLDYTVKGESQPRNRIWSFTTGKGRTLKRLSAQYDELVLNPGAKLPLQITARYTDGTSGSPNTSPAYSSSSPAGLRVSADGVLEALKPGSYKVTVGSGSVRTTVPVKVFEPLKSKNYPSVDPAKVKDIAGHSDREAIEWALRRGIAAPDANGNFRPGDPVTEAQFLTMLLRTYRVDDEAYASKKKRYWAEGAYQVAKDRGLLLFSTRPGKKEFRDQPINRYRAAGLIASADGVNFDFSDAVDYVLIRDYMRGTSGNQSWSFGSDLIVTRAQAAAILMKLQSGMKQLTGAPSSLTPEEKLPGELFPEVYTKPELGEKTLIAEFRADGTLRMEGQFRDQANRQLDIQVDERSEEGQSLGELEKIPVQTDGTGRFSVTSSRIYTEGQLNVYFGTEEVSYFIQVKKGTLNASDYSYESE